MPHAQGCAFAGGHSAFLLCNSHVFFILLPSISLIVPLIMPSFYDLAEGKLWSWSSCSEWVLSCKVLTPGEGWGSGHWRVDMFKYTWGTLVGAPYHSTFKAHLILLINGSSPFKHIFLSLFFQTLSVNISYDWGVDWPKETTRYELRWNCIWAIMPWPSCDESIHPSSEHILIQKWLLPLTIQACLP